MESVEHGLPTATEIPRFDDGMVNIQELIRIMAEALVNEIMDAQAEDACADGNQRNGYRERTLVTSVGVINLRIPKLRRGSYFPEDLLVRYSRVTRGDSGRVRDGDLRRFHEESGADSGADGHRPHELKPSIKDLRGAGRDDSRPAGTRFVR
ncbi:hypothetical protein ADLECEL_00280 [Adlercreutzia equolifaciens subsp. celatus]|uniref:transposase n=1 Tax=Adlercreutzia equolifaciens TaxID=446660 RepID=UPI001AFAD940|nr:transposase [Adlercreutzia equolifaciens]BCS56143.1 hypothetical protein ADLECEL_00280 [Adlercreutzia equolifaciens subsp. celatus]